MPTIICTIAENLCKEGTIHKGANTKLHKCLVGPMKGKYYFRITFCSDLICNKILMVRNLCVGVEFLTINVLLHPNLIKK